MVAIWQKTFSSAFSFEFYKKNFIEICFLGCNWQYDSIGSDNGLVPNRRQAIIWSNVGMFYWPIYASLGLNELNNMVSMRETMTWVTISLIGKDFAQP